MASSKANKQTLIGCIRTGLIDPVSGVYDPKGKHLTLPRAITQGLIDIESVPSCGLTLSDAVRQGVLRATDGKITDRNTGLAFSLDEAIERGLINKDKFEVYDEKQGFKITLESALSSGIIDTKTGRYLSSTGPIPLDQAAKLNKIQIPLTVKDSVDQGFIQEDGQVKDPITGEVLSLLGAVGRGFLDYELKSVRDVKGEVYVSLGEALGKNIINPNARFSDTLTAESMSLPEAVKKGFLTSVSQKTIFEIEGIKNPTTEDYISFNEALELRIIDKSNSTFFDKKTMTRMTLHEASDKDYIQNQLLDMLERPIGIVVMGTELTLLQAVMNKRLDPLSGLLIDPASKHTLPLEVAVSNNLITPMGAAVLKSLLNITVTTATVTQTVRRTIKVSSSAEDKQDRRTENSISFQEALQGGFINEATGMFTDPETGLDIALDEAINLGMVRLGQTSQSSVRKSSTASSTRKASTSSVASRKSSSASSRASSPPKSLNSAKEFLKESQARESRSTSLTMKMSSSQSSSRNISTHSSTNGSSASTKQMSTTTSANNSRQISATTSANNSKQVSATSSRQVSALTSAINSRKGSPEKTSRPSSRLSTSSNKQSPQKSKASTPEKANGIGKLSRHDSFEQRMEERSDFISAESKHDYSFKSSSTSIPIKVEVGSYNPPLDGYTLKDAIDEELLDPVLGLFKIPGTDRETSFKECLDLGLINSNSATVSLDSEKYSLAGALESSILDTTGHYSYSGNRISLREAIDLHFVSFFQFRETETRRSHVVYTQNLTENIRYDLEKGSYEVNPEIQPGELMSALKEGKILPTDIKVADPDSGLQVNILEAVSKGLIDNSTGEYTGGSKRINILEALKIGAVALVGAPVALAAAPVIAGKMAYDKYRSESKKSEIRRDEHEDEIITVERDTLRDGTIHARIVESGVTTTRISSFTVEVPGTGEEISLDEAVRRGLVTEETAQQYKEEVTTDKTVESMMVLILDPRTGEEIPSDEAIRRGIVTTEEVEEFLRMKEEKSRLSNYGSMSSLNTGREGSESRPSSVVRASSPVSRGSSRMTNIQEMETSISSRKPAASSSSSRATSEESFAGDSRSSQYSSTLTVDVNRREQMEESIQSVREMERSNHSVKTKIVNLKQGYALSSLDEVRNLQTGEVMSIYEAKLRGIASDIQGNKEEVVTKQVKMFVTEAVSRNLINFSSNVFINPATGLNIPIAEAIRCGLLITDFKEIIDESFIDLDVDGISAGDAFVHLFNMEEKVFVRKSHSRSYTLQEAVDENWINGDDIIFDVSSSSHLTIRKALDIKVLNGVTCEYTIKETNETMFLGDAAKKGLVALFPEAVFEKKKVRYPGRIYTLREAVDEGIYQTDTGLFFVMSTEEHVTIEEALSIGMLDPRSAEIKNTQTGVFTHLSSALNTRILHRETCKVLDIEHHTELNLLEAYERGLIKDVKKEVSPPSSPFDSINFWDAIENGQLNTHTGLFFSTHEEGKKLKLEEAIFRKYIDKKSAFVIDTWKRKHCSLSEATRKNIIKDGLVLNTTQGKYMSVEEAIKMNIIIRDISNLSLIETLDFGMYQPYSGKILVPGLEIEMSISEAIESRIIDHKLTIVKNRKSSRFVSTMEALQLGDIDGLTGMYGSMNLLEARSRGYLLSVDAMQAVQEKYRQAGENLENLNRWLEKVEREIASQEVPREDSDKLRNQINGFKEIKDDVDEHNRPVNNTLDIIAELVETGADVLSSAELNKLQQEGKQLKVRYDNVSNNSDKLLKRLVSAHEELLKFNSEVTAFRNWLEKAYKVLEDKEKQLANLNKVSGKADDIKEFVSDVMTHGADLKFLSISGQKFVSLSKEYVSSLNEFRLVLRQNNLKITESIVSEEVNHVSSAYHDLLARANALSDAFSMVGGKYKDYNDAVDRAKRWLKETEPKVAKICNEPVAAEPRVVEDQLNRAKALNNEIIANAKLIDDAKQAAANLLASLDDSQMSREERRLIEQTPLELQQRYDALRLMMNERCADLDSALVACQGVQDALANIANWLDSTDNMLAQIMKPASLIRERLDEQIRQLYVLKSDVESHEPSIHKMYESAQQFIQSSSNVRETKKIETKVKEVQKKFETLVKTVQTREIFFNEVSTVLEVFTSQVESFEVWYLETIDFLESKELLQMNADESAAKIDELVRRKEQMKPQYDEMIKNGKALVTKKDVTDAGPCKDTIKELEEKWRELGDILGERQASNRARKQSLNAYEALREQVFAWLNKMESRIEDLDPIALDLDMLNKQINDVKPLVQEYTGYSKTIDKLNELGMQYDNMMRGSIDMGSLSRRSSMSPRKPSLTPSLLSGGSRRASASPKFGPPGSPLRRESGMPMFQEASPIQTQLAEINNRYDMIGIKLGDRDSELTNMRDDVKKYHELLKNLATFLEKQERNFPQDSIPSDKREADKQLKVLKAILDQLYENQGQLDTARVNIKDLLKKNPEAPGSEILDDTLNEVSLRWKDLQERCKARASMLDEMKDFHDIHDNLNNWLNSKEKLMNILGPIASDPRLVQNQMSQIQVMKEEFNEKQPSKDRFNDIGENILEVAGASADGRNIEQKLDNINGKWDDLLSQLEERERALEAISGPTRDFLNLSNRLADNLSKVSDDLDDIAVSKGDAEAKLKALTAVAKTLDDQRPLFSEVMSLGDQLQQILTDPASKSEIKGKMGQVERQFNNCQRKLDNALAELENSAKEGKEFEGQCADAQAWLREMEGILSDKFSISADRQTLIEQVAEFDPIYKEVMSKEHEIIMILNRGKDIIAKAPKADVANIKKNLDSVEKSWQKVKKISQDRHNKLNICMEYCKKFYGAQEKFLPWLEKAEAQLERMEVISLVLAELKKQEKELQSFRNDVNRHSSEYDLNHGSGDTFQSSCDTDKEIVKEELAHMKERWDHLNYFISERAQAISDLIGKLGDFNDNARDLSNGLQRAEDKLKQTDGANKDPRLLDKIKGLLEEAKELEKDFGKVQKTGEDLLTDADVLGADGSPIADIVNGLGDRLGNLRDRLEDKAEDLKNAGAAVGEFNEAAKDIGNALAMLDDELNKMGPIARELKALYKQKEEVSSFLQRIGGKKKDILALIENSKQLINSGVVPNPRELQDTVSGLQKSIEKLEQRGVSRDKDIDEMIKKVQAFYDHYATVMNDIQEVVREEKNLGAVAGDTETIKSQLVQFKQFQAKVVSAVGKEVDKSNRSGQGLIQSAASGVNTNGIETDLEKMNELWNSLKQALAERERKLDQGLLQSGKYGEALNGLMSWMDEMEDMMTNQKPPSADYKVVKAQVQEQKFVQKLLHDRKGAVASLIKTGQEIAASADPAEKRRIEGEIRALEDRYGSLNLKCSDRMALLEDAMKMAKEYADKLGPLEKWLDKTEKKIKEMETVPTEEDQIQKRIREHEIVHDDIIEKQSNFDDLADVASALMQVVGDEDAQMLADKVEELTNRYANLVHNSDAIAQLLQDSMAGLRNLVMAYEDLLGWMEDCETRLSKFKILSVFTEKLMEQTEQLHEVTEEIVKKQSAVDDVLAIGTELMKHITNEEALSLKDKLDSLQRKYNDLASKASDLLKNAQDMLPLVQNFHESHNRISDWMEGVEGVLQSLDTYSLEDQESEIHRLEGDIQQHKPLLEGINLTGPQLCQLSPGEGARTIEGLVTRDNRRFDAICEQVQRRGERIALAKQKSGEVLGDIDELLSWFREVEQTIREADPPSHEPEVIRVQLKEHKALNDDISSQKGRVRDVLSNAKKVLRESAQTADTEQVREKMEDLKETMDTVIKLSSDRLNILESALPLAEHFYETHAELNEWLDDIEREVMNQMNPSMRPDQIARQQETVRSLMQSVQDHKPVVDRLNKTGGALLRLIVEDDSYRVQDIIESDNQRYNNIKADLRERMQALEDAMHECSQFTDKLDGMLNSLENTKDQLVHAEPISGHPEKIKEQMDDNNAIIDDLEKKEVAYEAVIKAADDIIQKAPNKQDPAIKDIKKKLDKLTGLWKEIQGLAKNRGDSLEDALALAEKFWDELQQVMSNLKDLQDQLDSQDPPAVEPKAIEAQKAELKEIKRGIDSTKPGYEKCRQSGNNLINVVGDSEKPELKRHIEDLDHAWDNITSMYARREQNLFEAMEKAMEFHDMLQSLLEFLARSEKKFDNLGAIGTDIDTVKKQIEELRKFKDEVDPWMVKIEALNRSLRRQADDLTERTSPDQARAIKEPLADVNRRWNDLNKGIVVRQKELEHALLRLGQFQHALSELLVWIDRTDKTLDTLKPVYGDPQVIEVELAKLKVIVNDIQAHQSSVDTLNDAGRQIIESEKGSREASHTQQKLNELNTKWNNLLTKGEDRQAELEDALREAQAFNQEIQDMLMWLNDVDTALSTSKPVGGLPETARDQLERFMEVYHDLDATAPKIDALLGRGHEYLKKSKDGQATNLSNNLKTLKARWDNILNRANDKKIKLEIALKEATEFHEALQAFIDWLTNAEKHLGNLKPVSRIMETILVQIEEHKEFQAEVSSQRETMLSLDKKGTHLKYFSQKQDVILIKNLLVSVQHRWEKVVSKSAERTRALDYGYKEAKEFHDAWDFMMGWLDEAHIRLDDMSKEVKNDPEKIKQQIMRHKEFQKELGEKQLMYDSTMKTGKTLIGKAPKTDEPVIKSMMTELKNKWNMICNLSVERQRKLEEALLFSGQFKDALKALMDWLAQMEKGLDDKQPVHGDLDTVIGLVEQHKNFEEELNSRSEQVEQLKQTAEELLRSAEKEDAVKIRAQVTELTNRWENVWDLSKNKTKRLEDALKLAEELHKSVNMLLEWLSDAEMKLRFAGPLPEDEEEVERQIADHARFMNELKEKEKDKDYTINLAQDILKKCHPDAVQVIKHWITIIQSRWDEVASWALQRSDKLEEHLKQLRELLALLDELMQWLIGKEQNLIQLEQEPLPDDLEIIQELLVEHQGFMDGLTERQPEIDAVCKPMRPKSQAPSSRRTSKAKGPGRDSREGSPDLDPSRRPSRFSPEREGSPNKSRKSSYYDRDGGSPQRDYPKPWLDFLNHDQSMADARKGPRASISRSSPGDRATPDRRGGPRFSERKGSRASVSQEGGIKNPRAKALWEKWRHVWVMAWERDRRLRDKLNYLQELENVKNFDWEEWRKRYLKFNNNKKSRVQDFFRKLDDDGDGYCPRDEFIDGILKNKFPSSKLEMNAVADKFDHGDGMIDWREFMVALRPDWEERGPLTDTQRIDDEIKRQVAQCTCRQKFKVFQVGEGKYRFGDSQKLRLVRILRSTVMVRVGGGWCALDEFLVKNDPCRVLIRGLVGLDGVAHHEHHEWFCPVAISEMAAMAADRPKSRSQSSLSRKSSASSRKSSSISGPPSKGRTNVELREQFTLAAGVSQSVVGFTSKMSKTSAASPTSSVSGEGRNGVSGPITKIKEKSERSIGMNVRSSVDYSYNDDPYSRRQSAAAGRNSLTPGSQPGSRPPSRHGSNMSLNSEDDGGRRGSNVRRSSSMRNGARGMRPTPVGFGSSVPRKTSTPGGDRNRTPSNSSTDRTPLSARARQPSNSNIPIPTNRTRTDSGSGPRLQRTGSNIGLPRGGGFGSSSALRQAVESTRGWQQ
ncbi:dystonin isoform X13 [Eurytemora carolleeae]|uniref:dystonin isoform X13 n=1 Tax=Eurytemora carolleeae TaxID=1294199 RepID=UPI000C7750B4|nr:dystonin isoform X13 [Eurytemora carolleeae]|eukprot:XP_023339655.1 dystonin-like isoform X13 [Eurytemora affinis]